MKTSHKAIRRRVENIISLNNITSGMHARLTPLTPYKLMQLILVRAFKSRPRKPIDNHEELFCLAMLLSASLRGWEIISFVPSIFLHSISLLDLYFLPPILVLKAFDALGCLRCFSVIQIQ